MGSELYVNQSILNSQAFFYVLKKNNHTFGNLFDIVIFNALGASLCSLKDF